MKLSENFYDYHEFHFTSNSLIDETPDSLFYEGTLYNSLYFWLKDDLYIYADATWGFAIDKDWNNNYMNTNIAFTFDPSQAHVKKLTAWGEFKEGPMFDIGYGMTLVNRYDDGSEVKTEKDVNRYFFGNFKNNQYVFNENTVLSTNFGAAIFVRPEEYVQIISSVELASDLSKQVNISCEAKNEFNQFEKTNMFTASWKTTVYPCEKMTGLGIYLKMGTERDIMNGTDFHGRYEIGASFKNLF
jgi:hypothetical protein